MKGLSIGLAAAVCAIAVANNVAVGWAVRSELRPLVNRIDRLTEQLAQTDRTESALTQSDRPTR